MPVFNNILAGASGTTSEAAAFQIDRSLRFNQSDSANLSRTISSSGNRRTWTLSWWMKLGKLGSNRGLFGMPGTSSSSPQFYTRIGSDDKLYVYEYNTSGTYQFIKKSAAVLRDPSAWYHCVFQFDSTQSTAEDGFKIYLNGTRLTDWSTNTLSNYSQGYEGAWNSNANTGVHVIGRSDAYFDGYMAEIHFVDGQALTADDFGELDDNNVWQPKEFTGTHNAGGGTIYSSQTITNENSSYTTDKMFDGVYGSSAPLDNSVIANETDGTYSVYTFASAISYSSSVRIFADLDTRSTDPDVKANTTSVTGVTDNTALGGANKKWYTVLSGSGTLSTVSLNQHGGYVAAIYAIEVDGTVLVDGGVNGFHLDFSDNSSNSALGNDSSGNNNNWTVNNLYAGDFKAGVTFDGTDDYLSFTSGLSDLQFDGDFCIEAFFKKSGNGDSGYDGLVSLGTNGSANDGWFLETSTSRGIQFRANGSEILSKSNTTTTNALTDDDWHHVAVARSGSTTKLFLDGTQLTSTTTAFTIPTTATKATIGTYSLSNAPVYEFKGTISNLRIVKGSAVYTANFTVPSTPLSNITNTTLLCCQSSSSATDATVTPGTLSANSSPVAGTVTPNPEDIDSLIDTPTNYTADSGNNGGNYCTFNPLTTVGSYNSTLSDGNLTSTASGNARAAYGTIAIPASGKYYFEVTVEAGTYSYIGVSTYSGDANSGYPHTDSLASPSVIYYGNDGDKVVDGTETSYGASYGAGGVIGVAVNADDNTIQFYKNGTAQGSISKNLEGALPYCSTAGGSHTFHLNCGQRPFAFTLPTNHVALCTTNLPDPTIADGSTAFDTVLYTGDGNSTKTISGLNFSPDFTWIKNRESTDPHILTDNVRGAGKFLQSQNTTAETDNSDTATAFSAFTSDGFTVGYNANWSTNTNNNSFVSWNWDAGSTAASSNTDGSITSQVRANQTAGISIVSWTGRNGTVGHGLNDKPGLIITKIRNSSSIWPVQHSAIGTNILQLESTAAAASDGSNRFNATEATNSVFTVGTWWNSDSQGIAYCWAPVAGYSAFGSYTGNGSTDGTFVYTGFRPKWIMVKRYDGLGPWLIVDTERNTFNVMDNHLLANDSAAENGSTIGNICDSVSNGFKFRGSDGWFNGSSADYIYAAFAEHPFKTSRAR